MLNEPAVRSLALLAPFFLLAGCVGDLHDLGGGSDGGMQQGADLSQSGGQDLAGSNPDGGMMPQAAKFDPDINNDIMVLGCTATACHGGTQIPILKDGAVAMNYTDFKAEATLGEGSPVLTKNLAGSGVTHGGGSKFQTKADPIYARWLAWINAGAPQ